MKQVPTQTKFTRVYEDENTTETWTFDLDKFTRGPISVEIKYKNGADKKWIKNQNEAKRVAKEQKRLDKIHGKQPKQTSKSSRKRG